MASNPQASALLSFFLEEVRAAPFPHVLSARLNLIGTPKHTHHIEKGRWKVFFVDPNRLLYIS